MWEQQPIVTAATVAERIARNAGVKRAEVITARLIQDERGWLRLAGWLERELIVTSSRYDGGLLSIGHRR